jgi:hypothetical protein
MTMETKPTYLIVSADELNRLVRENIALKKELLTGDACFPCDCCRSAAEHEKDCQGICEDCRLICRCRKCGEAHERFEWRGISPETEPTPEEEAELMNRLTARGRGHTHD